MTHENQKKEQYLSAEHSQAVPLNDLQGLSDRRRQPRHHDYPKAEPVEPGIHIAFIKAELNRHGYSQKRVATELKLTTPTIYQIIKGTGKSRRVAEFIAEKTGLTLEQMWPGKYAEKTEDATNTD